MCFLGKQGADALVDGVRGEMVRERVETGRRQRPSRQQGRRSKTAFLEMELLLIKNSLM